MKIRSDITQALYEQSNARYILNPVQAALFLKNGAILYDITLSKDDKLVFVFDKKQTEEINRAFCEYKLK